MQRWKFFGIIIIAAIVLGAALFYVIYSRGINKIASQNSQPIVVPGN